MIETRDSTTAHMQAETGKQHDFVNKKKGTPEGIFHVHPRVSSTSFAKEKKPREKDASAWPPSLYSHQIDTELRFRVRWSRRRVHAGTRAKRIPQHSKVGHPLRVVARREASPLSALLPIFVRSAGRQEGRRKLLGSLSVIHGSRKE